MLSLELTSNGNGREINGILFETLLSVQTIFVPQSGEQVPVQFGVRITNQSSISYRFHLAGFIPVYLMRMGRR